MWKSLIDVLKQVFTLTEAMQQNRADIKDLKQVVENLAAGLAQLRFEFELKRERDNWERERAASEHEKQQLRREIERLRSRLALPPAPNDPDDEK
jgi:SMC interacting uncharacterized protein involved in chromosome segregation